MCKIINFFTTCHFSNKIYHYIFIISEWQNCWLEFNIYSKTNISFLLMFVLELLHMNTIDTQFICIEWLLCTNPFMFKFDVIVYIRILEQRVFYHIESDMIYGFKNVFIQNLFICFVKVLCIFELFTYSIDAQMTSLKILLYHWFLLFQKFLHYQCYTDMIYSVTYYLGVHKVSDRGDFWAWSVEILVLASPTSYMLTSSGLSFIELGYILYISLKWLVIFLQPWTGTGYFSNSTGSCVTNC